MINNLKFNLPDGHDEKQIIQQLADKYAIKKEPAAAERFLPSGLRFTIRLTGVYLINHSFCILPEVNYFYAN
jgi:hypothetical protein